MTLNFKKLYLPIVIVYLLNTAGCYSNDKVPSSNLNKTNNQNNLELNNNIKDNQNVQNENNKNPNNTNTNLNNHFNSNNNNNSDNNNSDNNNESINNLNFNNNENNTENSENNINNSVTNSNNNENSTNNIINNTGFSGYIKSEGYDEGTVIFEFRPVDLDNQTIILESILNSNAVFPDLIDGEYGLFVWLDINNNKKWDGVWENLKEPAALMGITLPRQNLDIILKNSLPEPIIEDNPEWVELYYAAWEMAKDHIGTGTLDNNFADHYLDEAFSEQIFQWDTCFMTIFGRYGVDSFPVMGSLDNFYNVQEENGFICRVVNENDGKPCTPTDASDPMINPPLFGWVELLYIKQTGDLSRINKVLPVLKKYHDWIDNSVRTAPGLYFTSMLGSGMDNAPREAAYEGWVDITAQQAFGRKCIAELAELINDEDTIQYSLLEHDRICNDIRTMMWDDNTGFFFDLNSTGNFLQDKTLASVWPLIAGCANTEQENRVIEHLINPAEFWRLHVFPSTSADSPQYNPTGNYWRGGVWAPTNYAVVTAFNYAERHDLSLKASKNHIENLNKIYTQYKPDESLLSEEARGDGTKTLWELYSPDSAIPGIRWDNTYLGRQDFVGWTGLGPISMLFEQVIGLEADAINDTLNWRITRTDRHGVKGYRFGDQLIDIIADPRINLDDNITINVESSDVFTLKIYIFGTIYNFEVEKGSNTFEIDSNGENFAEKLVTSGQFPGYSILGNGNISVVYSDKNENYDTPGITHFYYKNFGTDLINRTETVVSINNQFEQPKKITGLDPFFAVYNEQKLSNNSTLFTRTYAAEQNAVIFQGAINSTEQNTYILNQIIKLREKPHIDDGVNKSEIGFNELNSIIWIKYTDGTVLAIGSNPKITAYKTGNVDKNTILNSEINNLIENGNGIAFNFEVEANPENLGYFKWIIAIENDFNSAINTVTELLQTENPLLNAKEYWYEWSPEYLCGGGEFCETAAANLYAARASSLNGIIPADLTGQFTTNLYPQLYPRDALMTARVFEETGHTNEAIQVVRYWLGENIINKTEGEFYARYDALGRAVDGGEGADFDVKEWDSNGYLALLVEKLGLHNFSENEKNMLFKSLDFLVQNIDEDGLFSEGGIVEWEGRLPSTAMTNWAGLSAGVRLAQSENNSDRVIQYTIAAGKIQQGLLKLYNYDELTLKDERNNTLEYNSSLLFGPIWGYPAGPILDSTYDYILKSGKAYGEGIKYFAGNGYGEDLFFFTTSAAAQYALSKGDLITAKNQLNWMVKMTNIYGLAPERIYQGGSGTSKASPLSWCAAETAIGIIKYMKAQNNENNVPTVDGIINPIEYKNDGNVIVDMDIELEKPEDAIAMFATVNNSILNLGVLINSQISYLEQTVNYNIYISNDSGSGNIKKTESDLPLSFASQTDIIQGALLKVEVNPSQNTCQIIHINDDSTEHLTECTEYLNGYNSYELSIDLSLFNIEQVQIIIETKTESSKSILPAHGALSTTEFVNGVYVTFEVDASNHQLNLYPNTDKIIKVSGNRSEIIDWSANGIILNDDGIFGDSNAGDNVWTAVVYFEEKGNIEYKYLTTSHENSNWESVEFFGDNRKIYIQDLNKSNRIKVRDIYGELNGMIIDP